ncbi:complex I NDUFA9 subunit family protein [Thermocrinis sp.]|uniref:complex I NDUFA9 subunit family protein n=1 Tax=Thermocrinis sp. TaxID=2024383 RepID=UPI002FDD1AF7
MERVAITGATGFVGRYIVDELLKRKYKVFALVRNVDKLKGLFSDKVVGVKVDFYKKDSIKKALEEIKPDAIIHLIGILTEDRRKNITFYRVHYLLSKTLYEVCEDHGVNRVIHMSSLGTHKEAPSEYHKTKYMAEEFLKASGLKYTIFRPSLILGPEQRLFFDMWKITKLLPVIALPGGGSYLFQPVDVRDVACAFVNSLERQESEGKVYELCGSETVSFKELLEDIFSKWNRKVLLIPAPKPLMYFAGKIAEKLLSPPPFSSDQMLMMWRDNVCGLDQDVETEGINKLCDREPIPYRESLSWSLENFRYNL